jgi:hypothetical protein
MQETDPWRLRLIHVIIGRNLPVSDLIDRDRQHLSILQGQSTLVCYPCRIDIAISAVKKYEYREYVLIYVLVIEYENEYK